MREVFAAKGVGIGLPECSWEAVKARLEVVRSWNESNLFDITLSESLPMREIMTMMSVSWELEGGEGKHHGVTCFTTFAREIRTNQVGGVCLMDFSNSSAHIFLFLNYIRA